MRKVVKLVFGLMFGLGVFVSANAQDSSANMPSEDDAIVCVQVSEDMFDCYVMEDSAGAETNPLFNEGNSNDPRDGGGINKDDQWDNKKNRDTDTTNWNQSEKNNKGNQPERPSGKRKGNIEGGSEVKEENRRGIEIYKEEEETNPGVQAMQ